MNEKIIKMIEEYGEERDFLKEYGSGGICGVEILGIQGNLEASVVKATERWRNIGLNRGLIVIEDSGEFVRCMYSADFNDNRVFSWTRGGEFSVLYDTFDDYIIDMFQVGIDNLKI